MKLAEVLKAAGEPTRLRLLNIFRQDLKVLHRATAQGECRVLPPTFAKQRPGLKGKPPSVRAVR